MKLLLRNWRGGSTYIVTAMPEQLLERLPLPGERIVLGDMGSVTVMSARDVSHLGHEGGWLMPNERHWELVVQTPEVGPAFENI